MKITDVETILLRLPQVREIGDGCQTICVIRVSTDEVASSRMRIAGSERNARAIVTSCCSPTLRLRLSSSMTVS